MLKCLPPVVCLALASSFAHASCGGGPGGPDGREFLIQSPQFIVGFKQAKIGTGAASSRAAELVKTARAAGVEATYVRRMATGSEIVRFTSQDNATTEKARARLAARPDVAYVVEDHFATVLSTTNPNDPKYVNQWGLQGAYGIKMPQAWALGGTGTGAIIAVVDTGITDHSEFSGQLVAGYDFISDPVLAKDGNGRDSDPTDPGDFAELDCGTWYSSWHGTKVAGIAAAAYDNANGIAGAAPGARIMPVRVIGAGAQGRLSDIADAIHWLAGDPVPDVTPLPAANRPEVINLSIGWNVPVSVSDVACGPVEAQAINSALQKGIVVVAAAGNSSSTVSRTSPAICDGVITVAASDSAGNRAVYDNQGGARASSASNFGDDIDLTAPGKDNWSTSNNGTNLPAGEDYTLFSGTSAAAPHVSAVVALMQTVSAQSPAGVLNTLKATSRPKPTCNKCWLPIGVIDAAAAVGSLGTPNFPPVASFTVQVPGPCQRPYNVSLTNNSSDPDGSISTTQWTLPGGTTSSAWTPPSFTLQVNQVATVTLTVTDNDGASTSVSKSVTGPKNCAFPPAGG